MNQDHAHKFAREWVEAWNAHDLELILTHFTDDVVFTSPVAEKIVPGSEGVIRGKSDLRDYWREGLRLIPDLRFEVIGVYRGIDAIVIHYRNQNNRLVCEVLFFRDDLVERGLGTYLENPSPAA
ncbi:MAG TPA: nuclear transport factor 2 family protein [Acidimicrobiales bacterium]